MGTGEYTQATNERRVRRLGSSVIAVAIVVTAVSGCAGGPESSGTSEQAPSADLVQTVGAPAPEELAKLLGVPVDAASGEINQYLIRAPQGSVDLSKVGAIHTDLGYSVGVTLADGTQIGFRFEPAPAKTP